MNSAFKIAPILAMAFGAAAGSSQAAVAPPAVETVGIKSILRTTQSVPGVTSGTVTAPVEKLQMFAGNSSSNSSSNGSSNSSSNSNSNSSSNSNSNSSSNSSSNGSSNSNSNSNSNGKRWRR